MIVYINDKKIECSSGVTLSTLLKEQNIDTKGIAVAIEQNVIPRTDWDTTQLKENNKLLIIKATQGG